MYADIENKIRSKMQLAVQVCSQGLDATKFTVNFDRAIKSGPLSDGISKGQRGCYVYYTQDRVLYVGEASKGNSYIANRVKSHNNKLTKNTAKLEEGWRELLAEGVDFNQLQLCYIDLTNVPNASFFIQAVENLLILWLDAEVNRR